MAKPACYAEVRFGETSKHLLGIVTHMNSSGLTMVPDNGELPATLDTPADIVVVGSTGVYRVPGRITRCTNSGCQIAFTEKLRKSNRRAAPRMECDLPVSFRCNRGTFAGPWHHAHTVNISTSGMCIEAENVQDLAVHLDVVFAVPASPTELANQVDSPLAARQQSAHTSAPIRAQARTIHINRMCNGILRAGVAFISIPPQDVLRLYSFIGG